MTILKHVITALSALILAAWLYQPAEATVYYSPSPMGKVQFLDGNGNPLNGGKLYTYTAGTTTPTATYSDTAGTANANPVILDSAGRATVFLSSATTYKFVLKTSADVTQWTMDYISPAVTIAQLDEAVTAVSQSWTGDAAANGYNLTGVGKLQGNTVTAIGFTSPGSFAAMTMGYSSGGNYGLLRAMDFSSSTYLPIQLQGSSIDFAPSATVLGRFNSTGLGILTDNPLTPLHVHLASGLNLYVESDGSTTQLNAADDSKSTEIPLKIKASKISTVTGILNLGNCPTYDTDADAGTAGLAAGDVYKNTDGSLHIKL